MVEEAIESRQQLLCTWGRKDFHNTSSTLIPEWCVALHQSVEQCEQETSAVDAGFASLGMTSAARVIT